MKGIKDIETLLGGLEPTLSEEEYVFCSFAGAEYGDFKELNPIGIFRESEGLTLIIKRKTAESNSMEYESTFRLMTLKAYSNLNAVGFTAAVSSKLAEKGIAANVVAGFHHDHIFVLSDQADAAMDALHELQKNYMKS